MAAMIERDTETIIDGQLRNLGWVENPKSHNQNVWKQSVKTASQRKSLGRGRPDYVLYETESDQPLVVIEAKRPYQSLEDAMGQGRGYAEKLKCPIVIVTDGVYTKTKYVPNNAPLIKDNEEIDNLISEVLAIQYITQETNTIETQNKKVTQSRQELIGIFDKANKILRSAGVQAGTPRFSEFSNLLFLKLMSELEAASESKSNIDKDYLWNSFNNKSGKGLISHLNNTVMKEFARIYNSEKDDIFTESDINDPGKLKRIIDLLDPLSLIDINSDIKGDAFEYFIRKYISEQSNDLGQYFTPRHIVKFCVKIANPVFREKIYDPFCGTGGMLIESFKHVRSKMVPNEDDLNTLKHDSVFGHEITPNARVAKMNMILMGDGHSNIKKCDSWKNLEEARGKYDVVITNIPFSAGITEDGNLYDIPTENANIVSIQHCMQAISKDAENGRAVLICGDDILVNDTQHYVKLREYMFNNATVKSVISLPEGVFSPYSNTKSNIIYLTDVWKKSKPSTYSFFRVKKDGYTFETNRNFIPGGENDLDIYLAHQVNHDHEKFQKVKVEDIKSNGYYMLPFQDDYVGDEFVCLGDITTLDRSKAGENYENYKIGTLTKHGSGVGGIVPDRVPGKRSTNRSKYSLVQPGRFVYRAEGAHDGFFGVNKSSHSWIVSGVYVVFSIDESRVLPDYLFNVLRSDFFKKQADDLMVGVGRAKLSYKNFEKIKIPLPPLTEQRKFKKFESKILQKQQEISKIQYEIQSAINSFYKE